MKSIRLLALGACWILLLPSGACGVGANIVLFVTDDQSPDAGCYGNSVVQTPALDQLAAAGTRFDLAFCTTASCSASRSVILTGKHNHATGQYGHIHSFHHFRSFERLRSLPARLAAHGYRTARIGKFHVAPEQVYPFHVVLAGKARSPVEMADQCRTFLADEDERPFFLYFCTSDPHRGGGRAAELPHRPNRFGNPPPGKQYPGVQEVAYDPATVTVPPFLPDTPICRAELAQYYQSISRVDQGLQRLLEILKATGRDRETWVVFTSDHGMAFPGGKTTVYEGGLRVPLIVRPPANLARPAVSRALVSLVDLAPTLLEIAGAPVKGEACHGKSFLAAIGDAAADPWDEVYASHTFHEIQMYYPMRVVRGRRYKLIWNIAHPLPFPFASDLWAAPTWQDRYQRGPDTLYGQRTVGAYLQRPRFELYDLETDPDETRNLADDPQHASLLAELQTKLRAFQERTGDGWVSKWEYE